MAIKKVSQSAMPYFPSLPISNPKSLGFAIALIASASVYLGLTIALTNRCYSTLSSLPECPEEPPCECELSVRFLQYLPFLIIGAIGACITPGKLPNKGT